jgi:hypothetical protein
VDALAATGRRSAQVARHLLDHIDRYLSACQAPCCTGWPSRSPLPSSPPCT